MADWLPLSVSPSVDPRDLYHLAATRPTIFSSITFFVKSHILLSFPYLISTYPVGDVVFSYLLSDQGSTYVLVSST